MWRQKKDYRFCVLNERIHNSVVHLLEEANRISLETDNNRYHEKMKAKRMRDRETKERETLHYQSGSTYLTVQIWSQTWPTLHVSIFLGHDVLPNRFVVPKQFLPLPMQISFFHVGYFSSFAKLRLCLFSVKIQAAAAASGMKNIFMNINCEIWIHLPFRRKMWLHACLFLAAWVHLLLLILYQSFSWAIIYHCECFCFW